MTMASLSQNQQMYKIVKKYKTYFQPLNMLRQMNYHPQGLLIKELQVLSTSRCTIGGFTVEVFTYNGVSIEEIRHVKERNTSFSKQTLKSSFNFRKCVLFAQNTFRKSNFKCKVMYFIDIKDLINYFKTYCLRAGWSGVRIPAGTRNFLSPKTSISAPAPSQPPI